MLWLTPCHRHKVILSHAWFSPMLPSWRIPPSKKRKMIMSSLRPAPEQHQYLHSAVYGTPYFLICRILYMFPSPRFHPHFTLPLFCHDKPWFISWSVEVALLLCFDSTHSMFGVMYLLPGIPCCPLAPLAPSGHPVPAPVPPPLGYHLNWFYCCDWPTTTILFGRLRNPALPGPVLHPLWV